MHPRHERQVRTRALHRRLRTLLRAWASAARDCRRLARLGARVALLRLRWLLAAWSHGVEEMRRRRRRVAVAEAHRRLVLVRCGWRGLAGEVQAAREAAGVLRQRLERAAKRDAFRVSVYLLA